MSYSNGTAESAEAWQQVYSLRQDELKKRFSEKRAKERHGREKLGSH